VCEPVNANTQSKSTFKIKTIARSISMMVAKQGEGKRQVIAFQQELLSLKCKREHPL